MLRAPINPVTNLVTVLRTHSVGDLTERPSSKLVEQRNSHLAATIFVRWMPIVQLCVVSGRPLLFEATSIDKDLGNFVS